MRFEQEKETSNQKALRLTLWILCFFSLGFALVNIPRSGDIDGIKQEIKSTNKQIIATRNEAESNSPLAATNNFNLIEQEKVANDKLSEGLRTTFGGLKTKEDFDHKKDDIQKLMGKKFTNFFVVYNPDTQYVKNDNVHVYFSNVTNIHNAKIFAYTQYQVKKGNESEPLSLGFEFDYDLATQKVNSYKIVTFSTTDVLASEGSNL
ncbi:hypothetical protein [Lactobacillus johnsonii]|uniref:hypothetical protein n=1 Tax=Lactobacillus johnsonii TaxID=33959 RepID=UPI0014351C49|nr:hypothetical protein [Lactobacillus johnsonii]GFI21172.1 hypothetical protein IMSAGC010_01733 [Lactobacillus johnsonii]